VREIPCAGHYSIGQVSRAAAGFDRRPTSETLYPQRWREDLLEISGQTMETNENAGSKTIEAERVMDVLARYELRALHSGDDESVTLIEEIAVALAFPLEDFRQRCRAMQDESAAVELTSLPWV
jgi:hypothetical protein